MEIIYSKGAKEDIKESAAYYENEVVGLGKAFLEIIEFSINEIRSFPYASRIMREPYRRFLVRRFPFGIIYRIEKNYIFIAAVMHLKRRPYYWLENLKHNE